MVEYYISTFYLSSSKKANRPFLKYLLQKESKASSGATKALQYIISIGMSNAFASMAGVVEQESGRTDCGWWGSVVIAGKIRPLL